MKYWELQLQEDSGNMAIRMTLVSLFYELYVACLFEWQLESEGESDDSSSIKNAIKDPCMSPSTRISIMRLEKKLILKKSFAFWHLTTP